MDLLSKAYSQAASVILQIRQVIGFGRYTGKPYQDGADKAKEKAPDCSTGTQAA